MWKAKCELQRCEKVTYSRKNLVFDYYQKPLLEATVRLLDSHRYRMSTCSSELFLEMHALALRYGVDKCETALKDVKYAFTQQRVVTAKRDLPKVICLQNPNMLSDGSLWMRWCLTDSLPEKFNLMVYGDPLGNGENTNEYNLFCGRLHEFRTFSSLIEHPQHVGPLSGCQRVQSRLHTLELFGVGKDTFNGIFEDKRFVVLFEKVLIQGKVHDVSVIKRLVVEEGVISSLTVQSDDLDVKDGMQFATMLEGNRLQSLEMEAEVDSPSFAHALVVSLNRHVEVFAYGSILRDLDLNDTMHCLDSNRHCDLFRDLLHVVGSLPTLKSFGIQEPRHPCLLQILVEAIGHWKIRHFKLWRWPSEGFDLQPLFHSISSSRHVKAFSICINDEIDDLAEFLTPKLFDLALSPRSGLLEVDLSGYEVYLGLYDDHSRIVPEDCDRATASQCHLRRLCMLSKDRLFGVWGDRANVFEYLQLLFKLVSKHLPFLYDDGLTPKDCADVENCLRKSRDSKLLRLWNEVRAQMELNRVGMSLLRSEVLPTVPGGLWPEVLHHAISCEENPAHLPWTGIYTMVRVLVENGHIGWSESKGDSKRGDSSPTKRRRQ